MPKIEPHIKNYIDITVKESVNIASKKFGDEIRDDLREYAEEYKRHTSDLVGHLEEHIEEIERVAKSLPTKERVREIFREEIQPFDMKLGLCVSEIGQVNKKLDYHERRIHKLELTTA